MMIAMPDQCTILRFSAAPSALITNLEPRHHPGRKAGAMHCRPFGSRKNADKSSIALMLVLFLFAACSRPETAKQVRPEAQDRILQERSAKDAAFKSEGSPLLPGERAGFRGLSYYPVNQALRFSVRLNRFPTVAKIKLGTNTGEIRDALRYGYFDFEVEGKPCRLQVYRLEDDAEGNNLFIPFRDSTSGKESYGAGRYIDLKENTTGIYDLDFNRAYNPSCAYNATFSCPVPPAENTLKVPIRAGEKKYHQ